MNPSNSGTGSQPLASHSGAMVFSESKNFMFPCSKLADDEIEQGRAREANRPPTNHQGTPTMADTHPGFEDHKQLKRHAQAPLDPHKQAPREVKDGVWDMVQGRAPKTQQDDDDVVTIPLVYTNAILVLASRELTRIGLTKGVTLDFRENIYGDPLLQIMRKRSIVGPDGKDADVVITNLTMAFAANMDPGEVGREAARRFAEGLDAVLA